MGATGVSVGAGVASTGAGAATVLTGAFVALLAEAGFAFVALLAAGADFWDFPEDFLVEEGAMIDNKNNE